jgi:hypothetical protein
MPLPPEWAVKWLEFVSLFAGTVVGVIALLKAIKVLNLKARQLDSALGNARDGRTRS